MDGYSNIAIMTAIVGIAGSVIVGIIKSASDTVDKWPALMKQLLVLGVCSVILVVLHFFDVSTLPVAYQGTLATIAQALIASLTGIGSHNVKDAVTSGQAGVH